MTILNNLFTGGKWELRARKSEVGNMEYVMRFDTYEQASRQADLFIEQGRMRLKKQYPDIPF